MVTKGAIFDYEEIVAKKSLEVTSLRRFVEKAVAESEKNVELKGLRLPYNDGENELLLFIRRGYRFGIMQGWIVEGICAKDDYHHDMEDDGTIAEWLEVTIE